MSYKKCAFRCTLYSLLCVTILFLLCINAYSAINVPITVTETVGIDRNLEPVTFGFPIPEEADIRNVNFLCVKNNGGAVIPAQFRVLERWDTAAGNSNGKIKWVLVDYQVTAAANRRVRYTIEDSGQTTTSPTLSVQNDGSVITVNTGEAEFTINRNNFGILSSASYGSTQVISNSATGGIRETAGGSTYTSQHGTPDVFEVEENGPMRVVVHAEGYNNNGSNNGLRYVCRIHFFAGKPYCKVVYYYIHDQNLGDAALNEANSVRRVDKTINNLEVNFNIGLASTPSYAIGNTRGNAPWSGQISSGSSYCYQSAFNSYSGSSDSGSGQLVGWMNLHDSAKGMMIAVKNFYNKWPHALYSSASGEVSYKILPENAGTHDFYIYQAHREEFLVYLHGSNRNQSEMQNLAEGFVQAPLFPHPTKNYMSGSKGLGELSPYPSSTYTGFENSLEDAYNQTTANQVSQNMNGRWDYGGVFEEAWSGHPSNYYDGIGVATRQFARSADLKWLNFAINYAENFTSVDQYYCGVGTKDRTRWNAISSGYMGHHHRSGNFIFTSWMEGTLLLYRLTGDEWFYDRAVDLAQTYLNRGTNRDSSYAWGVLSREGGQAFLTMLRVWEINRDAELYAWWTSHADRLVSYQQANGTFRDGGYDSRHWQAIMNLGPGLYRAYLHTRNDSYLNAITKYADAMQPSSLGGCMIYTNGNGYDYVERECQQTWAADNSANTGPRISCVNAYAYRLTGNQKYFNEAHRQLTENWSDYGWENGLGKTANTYHWVMVMEGILSGPFDFLPNERCSVQLWFGDTND